MQFSRGGSPGKVAVMLVIVIRLQNKHYLPVSCREKQVKLYKAISSVLV